MALPKFLQPYLPSYDISKIDLRDPTVKREIITQILNYGDKKDVLWLFRTYTPREIKWVISNPKRGCWQERALNYWTKIFNVKLHKVFYEAAILSLHPRPELMRRYFKLKQKAVK